MSRPACQLAERIFTELAVHIADPSQAMEILSAFVQQSQFP
jgi:hypothetical protein